MAAGLTSWLRRSGGNAVGNRRLAGAFFLGVCDVYCGCAWRILDVLPGLEKEYREQLTATMLAYGRTMDLSELDYAWSQFSAGGTIDFGNLPEELQRKVISEVTLPELSAWFITSNYLLRKIHLFNCNDRDFNIYIFG